MTAERSDMDRAWLKLSSRTFVVLSLIMGCVSGAAFAQEKQLVQIKTLDQQLKPLTNIEVSINDKPFIAMGSKGVAFVELTEQDLPVKSVKVNNESLEAASWNHSKGILEIIIRKKSYQLIELYVRDAGGKLLPGTEVTFNGRKTLTATTDSQGKIEILLALDEKITSANQFRIDDHRILRSMFSEKENSLTIEQIQPEPLAQPEDTEVITSGYFKNFDLSKIDSIQSLTAFHAIFKNYSVADMNEEVKQKLDAKLNELVQQLQDSARGRGTAFVGRISDSSFVSDDLENLLAQATLENRLLEDQRKDFDEKIRVVNEKLANGGQDLDEATRAKLLADLAKLERMLEENENRFYKNQSDYRSILNSLKEKFFQIDVLENKISVIEAERLEEQRVFRQRLFTILAVALVFALFIVLLIYFGNKLRKQKGELEIAHGEVKRINENLESLVNERTALLKESNRELDLFLYKASHDLRSPVTSIIGLCNIATHISSSESRELFDKAGQTAHAMDRLLKKLRIISEVNQPGSYTSIDLLTVVEGARSKYKPFIEQHNIDFHVDCEEDLNVYSNATLTEAIIFNLIENAIFYSVLRTSGQPKVEIAVDLIDDQLQISVYDNGPGIGSDIRDNIFDMFFIGHENSKGNGLGLYIVDKSVQAMKGNITVDTECGAYSRFVINLPMRSPLAPKEPSLNMSGRIFAEAR